MEDSRNEQRACAVDTNDILHAAGNNFPLFYNSQYDLGKHLTALEEPAAAPVKQDGHFTLARMNISTKSVTPPEMNLNKPRRNFLFINSGGGVNKG